MGKVVKVIGAVAGIAAVVASAGSLALFGTAVGASVFGVSATTLALASGVAGLASRTLFKPKAPKVNRASQGRLFASIDPHAGRKMVFGRTAMATDVIYQGYTGTDQEFYHLIIAVAAHKATAIEDIWFEDKQAWTIGGGITTDYSGYLTVATVLEGSAVNMIDIDAKWGSATNRRLTGCAYVHLRFKLTGNSKKSDSPFASSVPTRMTIIGKGAPVYDPRRDSTRGGSGSHRAEDQSTWAWDVGGDEIGRNAALCELAWLIGWRIGGKVSVGRGVPLARIDFASFITAANACDEVVTLAAGGSEPRYRFDGVVSEDEDGRSTRGIIETAMNGELRDLGGRLGLQVFVNDIASPVVSFMTDDFVGPFEWTPVDPIDADRNIGRGRYTDARTSSLYQLNAFPEVTSTSPDGIDRILTRDYPGVQSVSQAQRLIKQDLQRLRYAGVLQTTVNAKGWACRAGDPVRVTHSELGFVNKPFRVREAGIDTTGRVPIVLTEEDAALYAWVNEDGPALTLGGTVVYDPLNAPLIQQLDGIENFADVTANNDPRIVGNLTWELQANSAGTITSALPATRRFSTFKGATDVSTTSAVSITTTGGVAATVDNTSGGADRGVITLGTGTTSGGSITLTSTLSNGAVAKEVIAVVVNRAVDVPGGTGGAGSGSATGSLAGVTFNSTTFAAIGQEIQVQSDGAAKVKISLNALYSATNTMTGQFRVAYATSSGGALTALGGTDVTGTTFVPGEGDASADLAEVEITMPAATTNYFFRAQARRSSGSGTVTPTGSFMVRKP
jgi:hypothetical protein